MNSYRLLGLHVPRTWNRDQINHGITRIDTDERSSLRDVYHLIGLGNEVTRSVFATPSRSLLRSKVCVHLPAGL
jgi:hypothetical protein